MIERCPFCNEPMSYRGYLTVEDKANDVEPFTFDSHDSYCIHCQYAFNDDMGDLIVMGDYAFGDPYQVQQAVAAGQLALL